MTTGRAKSSGQSRSAPRRPDQRQPGGRGPERGDRGLLAGVGLAARGGAAPAPGAAARSAAPPAPAPRRAHRPSASRRPDLLAAAEAPGHDQRIPARLAHRRQRLVLADPHWRNPGETAGLCRHREGNETRRGRREVRSLTLILTAAGVAATLGVARVTGAEKPLTPQEQRAAACAEQAEALEAGGRKAFMDACLAGPARGRRRRPPEGARRRPPARRRRKAGAFPGRPTTTSWNAAPTGVERPARRTRAGVPAGSPANAPVAALAGAQGRPESRRAELTVARRSRAPGSWRGSRCRRGVP